MNDDGGREPLALDRLNAVGGGRADDYRYYQPTVNDTLDSIARRFDTTVETLLALNPFIDDPRILYTNWQMKVPVVRKHSTR